MDKECKILVVGTETILDTQIIDMADKMSIELIATEQLKYKAKEFPIINIPEMSYYDTDSFTKMSKHRCTRIKVRDKKQKKTHRKKKRK